MSKYPRWTTFPDGRNGETHSHVFRGDEFVIEEVRHIDAEAIAEMHNEEVDTLKATIQAAIGVIDNWKVPLLDPDGKDCSEAVMRLLADDLRKVLEDE